VRRPRREGDEGPPAPAPVSDDTTNE
jgi:hypothetical protein